MTITIREAQKSDCARMMELVNELALYEKAPEQVTVNFDHFVESGFGQQPVWWAYVAEAEGVVQGFALYYIRYSTWKGQRMYLEDIVVTEKMRGHGMGKLLLDKLVDVAKQKKYSGIVWQVLNWNEPAINFYKKFNATQFDADWINCCINL
jgi:L-amino acid N-acyltransferase YncA